MQEHPDITGEPDDLPEACVAKGEGLLEKVFSLRQKLYRKAKCGSHVSAERRTIRESRMREIRTSGSTRGD